MPARLAARAIQCWLYSARNCWVFGIAWAMRSWLSPCFAICCSGNSVNSNWVGMSLTQLLSGTFGRGWWNWACGIFYWAKWTANLKQNISSWLKVASISSMPLRLKRRSRGTARRQWWTHARKGCELASKGRQSRQYKVHPRLFGPHWRPISWLASKPLPGNRRRWLHPPPYGHTRQCPWNYRTGQAISGQRGSALRGCRLF